MTTSRVQSRPAMIPIPGSRILQRLARAAVCGFAFIASAPAWAQVPPSADDAARYTGLHAAAHKGDAAQVAKLAAGGANVNARDAYGRTPLHVATFARQGDYHRIRGAIVPL